MMKSIEVTGKTEAIAIDNAAKQLGLDRDDFSVEVIARAKSGFLGIGSQPARIRVTYEVPDAPAEEKPKPEEKKQETKKQESVKPQEEKKSAELKQSENQPTETAETRVKKPAEKSGSGDAAEKKAAAQAKKESGKSSNTASGQGQKKQKKGSSGQNTGKPQSSSAKNQSEKPKAAEPEQTGVIPSNPEDFEAGSVEEKIYTFLTGLLEHMGSSAQVKIQKADNNTYQVELTGQQGLGSLIGRRGETLDAIQQLTNYSVNRGQNHRVRIHLDAENYRAKREESLQRLARKTAGKVVKNRRNITLEPMNAYERHVIHTALQDYRNVTTYSIGTEPNRRIVIAYTRGEQRNSQ